MLSDNKNIFRYEYNNKKDGQGNRDEYKTLFHYRINNQDVQDDDKEYS